MIHFNSALQRLFPIFLIAGALLGIYAPDAAFTLRQFTLVCLAVLIFFPALKLNPRSLISSFALKIYIVATSLPIIFGLIPLLVYFLGRITGLDNMLLAGLVLAAAAPTMLSAPYFTNLIKGEVEVAFSISILSTLVSPLLIPLIYYSLLGKNTSFDAIAIAEIIFFVMAIPILIAIIIKNYSSAITDSLLLMEQLFTVIALVLINWIIIGINKQYLVSSIKDVLLPLFLIASIQNYGVFFFTRIVSKYLLPNNISKALAISYSLKNVALVGGVLVTFSDSLALASSAVSLVHVSMFIMLSLWKDRL